MSTWNSSFLGLLHSSGFNLPKPDRMASTSTEYLGPKGEVFAPHPSPCNSTWYLHCHGQSLFLGISLTWCPLAWSRLGGLIHTLNTMHVEETSVRGPREDAVACERVKRNPVKSLSSSWRGFWSHLESCPQRTCFTKKGRYGPQGGYPVPESLAATCSVPDLGLTLGVGG